MNAVIQAILSFVLNWLWNKAQKEIQDALVTAEIEKRVKVILADYDKVVQEAEEMKKDGLTEEEKRIIREKKIALEKALLNDIRR